METEVPVPLSGGFQLMSPQAGDRAGWTGEEVKAMCDMGASTGAVVVWEGAPEPHACCCSSQPGDTKQLEQTL